MIIYSKNSILILSLFLCSLSTLLTLINTQNAEISELPKKFEKVLVNFNQTNQIFQEISNKMKDIKFNFILKIKYGDLIAKKEKILQKINNIKVNLDKNNKIKDFNLAKELHNLNIHIESFSNNCYKIINLYESFGNINTLIANITKIFIIIIIIAIIFAIIFSGIKYIYIYRRRKNYEILSEEINHSSFSNINDSIFENIKPKGKTKKKKNILNK